MLLACLPLLFAFSVSLFVLLFVFSFLCCVTGGCVFALFRGFDVSLCLPVWLAGVFVVRVGAGSRQAHVCSRLPRLKAPRLGSHASFDLGFN